MYSIRDYSKEGDIGVFGIAVLSHFSYGFMVFSIENCGIAVSPSTTVCGFSSIFEQQCSVKILILCGISVMEVSLQR